MRTTNAVAALALACVTVAMLRDATAQSAADADARRLALQQAQEARQANDHQRALDFALRAGAIAMTPSLREFIAEEYGALGMVGEALRTATLCEREATADHAVNTREAILTACRTMITTLRPRVGYVVLHADAPPAGLEIHVAGQPVNVILLDADYAVTPGSVAIDASAPGRSFATHVSVAAGGRARVELQLHAVEAPRAAAQTSASSAPPASAPPPSTASEHAHASSGIGRPLALASLAVGAALLIGSAVTLSYFYLGVVAHCSTNGTCETDAQAMNASSLSMPLQVAGYGMLVAGGVLAVVGAVGFVMTGHGHDDVPPQRGARGIRVAPIVGSFTGIALGADF